MMIATVLMHFMTVFHNFSIVSLYCINLAPYVTTSAIAHDTLIKHSDRFRKWTNFKLGAFYKYLLQEIIKMQKIRKVLFDNQGTNE